MTSLNDESLVTVASRPDEVSASVLVNVLADEGIRAVCVGGYTAGFRAEAPGCVDVKTLQADSSRARQILSELKQESES
ncbi:MAG: DUF2007 domain-containing protein [Planctomycetota bacterium]